MGRRGVGGIREVERQQELRSGRSGGERRGRRRDLRENGSEMPLGEDRGGVKEEGRLFRGRRQATKRLTDPSVRTARDPIRRIEALRGREGG
jgi:hypothetical protein